MRLDMDLHCGWVQTVLAVLILVFVIWPIQILSASISWWIVVISATLLLIHGLSCHKCCGVCVGMNKKGKSKRGNRSRKR